MIFYEEYREDDVLKTVAGIQGQETACRPGRPNTVIACKKKEIPLYQRMSLRLYPHATKCHDFFRQKANTTNSKYLLFASKPLGSFPGNPIPPLFKRWEDSGWTATVTEKRSRKEKVDMELAVACLKEISDPNNSFDRVTIVSSDGDYLPLVAVLREKKLRVTLWYHSEQVSPGYLQDLKDLGCEAKELDDFTPQLCFLKNKVALPLYDANTTEGKGYPCVHIGGKSIDKLSHYHTSKILQETQMIGKVFVGWDSQTAYFFFRNEEDRTSLLNNKKFQEWLMKRDVEVTQKIDTKLWFDPATVTSDDDDVLIDWE